ncbi:MAG TPA: class I SAM-dependent methyltransferase [Polyangiaceae bacterium]
MIDPKERFSNRVDDYVRYRPGYPDALVEMLAREAKLDGVAHVVDVGSGTGILTRQLLAALGSRARVAGIEPNRAMREAAEKLPSADGRFESVDASAEATSLPGASADLIVAAQAFHWFDSPRARVEFARILKPTGIVALVWNQRRDTPLNRDYEEMLERFAPEYAGVRESDRASEPKIRSFFAPVSPCRAMFDNEQRFDEAGIKGRLLSASYCPPPGDPNHAPIMKRLGAIFRAHSKKQGASGGREFVTFLYDTVVWYGPLHAN